EPRGPVLPRRAEGLTIGCTAHERLAVFAGVGAALRACRRRCERAIGAPARTFDHAKGGEEVHRPGGALVDHRLTQAAAKGAERARAWSLVMQAGAVPVATALVAVVPSATPWGVIVVLIHFGGHCEEAEAGRGVTVPPSGTRVGRTQGAGEAEVQGGTDEPAAAAVDIALRRQRHGAGHKF